MSVIASMLPQQPYCDEGMTHLTPEDMGLWEILAPGHKVRRRQSWDSD